MIDQELLELLGISEVTPERAAYITERVYNDNEVLLIAEKLCRESFICAAVRWMAPNNVQRLVKRIQPEQVQVQEPVSGNVTWAVDTGMHSGEIRLHGRCTRCAGDVVYTGSPDDAKTVRWAHCKLGPSSPTEFSITEYRNQLANGSPEAIASYRDTAATVKAMKPVKQSPHAGKYARD